MSAFDYGSLLNSSIGSGAAMAARGQEMQMQRQAQAEAVAHRMFAEEQDRQQMELMRRAQDDMHEARVQELATTRRKKLADKYILSLLMGGPQGAAGMNPAVPVVGGGGAPPSPGFATMPSAPSPMGGGGGGLGMTPPQAQGPQQAVQPDAMNSPYNPDGSINIDPETLSWASDDMQKAVLNRKAFLEGKAKTEQTIGNLVRQGGYKALRGVPRLRAEAEKYQIELPLEAYPLTDQQQKLEDESMAQDTWRRQLGLHPSQPEYSLPSDSMHELWQKKVHAEQQAMLAADKANAQQQEQERVGALIQKKRAGQALTPAEEGALAMAPQVNQSEVSGPKDRTVELANFRLSRLKDVAEQLGKRHQVLQESPTSTDEQVAAAEKAYLQAQEEYLQEARNGARVAGSPSVVTQQPNPENVQVLKQFAAQLQQQLGRMPTKDELKQALQQAGIQVQPSASGGQR